ncbi:DUF2336 domain-containing protein [Roseomonas xinghualingensis]|uniref:DUF2336 domain-containing protein n=1 Tax=Roseomonas xinghualingensis TaxID=2986475 RepID=UPI0021F10A18|nr:DUF2336 domain-containing protein [Roseomonas sp. SXEYE001]MCV4208061.1 DUF2336 domain-containing protein [Roseomonas sp. SXEYE001]
MHATTAASPRRMDEATRAQLAERPDTPPEMLFFLANDTAITVRAAVAANAATPPLADRVLARDTEPGVRRMLARKLACLAPLLDPGTSDRQRRIAWETLCLLAEDDAIAVRAAVTEQVAEQPDIPRPLILRLAQDVAMAVAEPVLRGSPLLEEADLLWLIANPPSLETLGAIARRPNLPEAPSDAIAERADGPSVAALLANATARIRDATLLAIASGCGGNAAWQAAIVRRPKLTEAVLQGLAGLLAEEALNVLLTRTDLDTAVLATLHRGRPQRQPVAAQPRGLDEKGFIAATRLAQLPECARILAALSGLPAGVVARALALREAPVLVALCWKARLSGRAAAFAQLRLAGSPPEELLVLPGGIWAMEAEKMQALVDGLLVTA